MIDRLASFIFGKAKDFFTGQSALKTKNCPVGNANTHRVKPLAFTNSNYRPSSFSLKIDSFMLGLDEKQKKTKVYNILRKLRESGQIINETKGNKSLWFLVKS